MASKKYTEALKKLQAEKPQENRMLVSLDYSTKLILAHKDGLAFMQALASAEFLEDSYGKPKRIKDFDRSSLKVEIMSPGEYRRIKMATLLNVDASELETLEQEEEVT